MPKDNQKESQSQESTNLIKKLMPENKALTLSLAITLALSSFAMSASSLAVDPSNPQGKDTVLMKEKEANQQETDWEEDEEQSYSSYNTGMGYYYRPFLFMGGIPGRATWSTSPATKSVGGYHISRGHVGS